MAKKRTYTKTKSADGSKSKTVTRRSGKTVSKTKSADGSKSKTTSTNRGAWASRLGGAILYGRVPANKTKTKTKSADGTKAKTTKRTIGVKYGTGKGTRKYLAETEITKTKTSSPVGKRGKSKSKSKIIKTPEHSSESKKRINRLGYGSGYVYEEPSLKSIGGYKKKKK
jgi:hypothetical protein